MISYDEALARVLAEVRPTGTETVPLGQLSGRVLAASVLSQVDLPAYDNSAMDGYAVRTPVKGPLKLAGELAAGGDPASVHFRPGQAVRIFTGSALPVGADAVVMQEQTRRTGDTVVVETEVESGAFIRRKGEELAKGDELATAGRLVDPALLGLLAAAGVASFAVYRRPRASVVETGAELIEPGRPATASSVYAANGLALGSAARELGAEVRTFRCGDEPAELESVLRAAAADCDVLITSGGVSVGDHDLVKPTLKKIGVEELFWRVAIRPGRPVFFGKSPGLVAFGLPGNPASSLVTFLLFVRPALLAIQGLKCPSPVPLRLAVAVDPAEGVETFLRVQIKETLAYPIERQGSNMASSVAMADALLRVPAGSGPLPVGTELPGLPIMWTR